MNDEKEKKKSSSLVQLKKIKDFVLALEPNRWQHRKQHLCLATMFNQLPKLKPNISSEMKVGGASSLSLPPRTEKNTVKNKSSGIN